MNLMKAIVYTKYGKPDVFRIKEIEKPIPKDNEVLIRINAVEVTKADCELRSFKFAVKWFWLPLGVLTTSLQSVHNLAISFAVKGLQRW